MKNIKFEYEFFNIRFSDLSSTDNFIKSIKPQLNELGKSGWEVIQMPEYKMVIEYYDYMTKNQDQDFILPFLFKRSYK